MPNFIYSLAQREYRSNAQSDEMTSQSIAFEDELRESDSKYSVADLGYFKGLFHSSRWREILAPLTSGRSSRRVVVSRRLCLAEPRLLSTRLLRFL